MTGALCRSTSLPSTAAAPGRNGPKSGSRASFVAKLCTNVGEGKRSFDGTGCGESLRGPSARREFRAVRAMNKRVRRRFDAALLPRLFGNNVPGHTTRAPPVGFELATNGIQFYAIANCTRVHEGISTPHPPFRALWRGVRPPTGRWRRLPLRRVEWSPTQRGWRRVTRVRRDRGERRAHAMS